MPAATDQQVQTFVNERFRPFAEAMRAVYLAAKDNTAAIDDVYDACEPPESATWTDNRPDGPPHLLAAQDVLSWNAFMAEFVKAVEGHGDGGTLGQISGNWATIMKACVHPVVLTEG